MGTVWKVVSGAHNYSSSVINFVVVIFDHPQIGDKQSWLFAVSSVAGGEVTGPSVPFNISSPGILQTSLIGWIKAHLPRGIWRSTAVKSWSDYKTNWDPCVRSQCCPTPSTTSPTEREISSLVNTHSIEMIGILHFLKDWLHLTMIGMILGMMIRMMVARCEK